MLNSIPTGKSPATHSGPAGRSDRPFFLGVAIAIAILVLAGFARTFYLHGLFGVPAPATFMSFHGALMSGWILLYLVQTWLVSVRRLRWHRTLGVFGACYAAVIAVVGCMATLIAAAREVRAHSPFVSSQLDVLALELAQMLLFACLVGAAVRLRNRHDWHKRLMLLATLCILPNAVVRLSLLTSSELLSQNIALLTLWALLVVAVVAIDTFRRRRLHPAFGFVGAAVLLIMYCGHFVGISQPWFRFASSLVS
jgi:hypothetical protein